MGSIFHDRNIAGNIFDSVNVHRNSGKMHRHDHFGTLCYLFCHTFRSYQHGLTVDLSKYRSRSDKLHHVDHRHPRHGGKHNFISRTDIHTLQKNVHGSGRTCKRNCTFAVGKLRDCTFKIAVGWTVGYPSGSQNIAYTSYIILGHLRTSERQKIFTHFLSFPPVYTAARALPSFLYQLLPARYPARKAAVQRN